MAIPTKKANTDFLEKTYGRTSAIEANMCIDCGCDILVKGFRTMTAWREYHISGYCQTCQDEIFTT